MDMLLLRGIVHVLVFLLGLSLVTSTVVSAMLTFVLPHSAPDLLTRAVFGGMRWLFPLRLRRTHTYLERDRVLELYAPLSLLSLPLSLPYPPDPHFPAQPISITRAEFDAACTELARNDVPLKADRELAWNDFAGWRVNYDTVLLALCTLTPALPAPWSSDRAPQLHLPLLQLKRR